MFQARPNKFFYKLSVCIFSYLLFGFFVVGVAFAQTVSRAVPTPQKINLPNGGAVSGSCPTFPSLANHISICGIAKTIDINVKDGVQYAQEPIKGATVAAYLGVKYSNLGSLSKDPNGTGELVGLIERLYTYDITNADGRFVLPVPKGAGTNGFIFLGFFCGDMLKDLYMIDTSQDLPYMPVSLACPPKVTPAAVNAIPAPPSINYADRTNFVSCEDSAPSGIVSGLGSFTEGDPGMVKEAPRTVNLPLQATALDNTRGGARVTQEWSYVCEEIAHPYQGTCGNADQFGCTVYCCLNSSCCCQDNDPSCGADTYTYKRVSSEPVGDPIFHSDPIGGGHMLEVPKTSPILSRRDLEGFTHTSMGYSFQAISSLNCGISGCYNTGGPSAGHTTNEYLNQTMVGICNTEPFPPLNCKGPGIELAEPREWTKSYELQKEVEIYPGKKLGDVTLPQYSALGQLIQEILNKFGVGITADPTDTPDSIIAKIYNMYGAISDNKAILQDVADAQTQFNQFVIDIGSFKNASLLDRPGIALKIAQDYVGFIFSFYSAMGKVAAVISFYSLNQNAQVAYQAAYLDLQAIRDAFILIRNDLLNLNFGDIGVELEKIVTSVEDIANQFAVLMPKLNELLTKLKNVLLAIDEISKLKMTTVSRDFFPYSTVLNYGINKNFREAYLNRPINDSYANFGYGPDNIPICHKSTDEQARQSPSSLFPAEYPFNACYESTLLGEDTYSTQKALYLTTKNTSKNLKGEANDPVVSKFLAPGEPVGAEVSPKAGELNVTPVTDTPKVGGKGYWRLGVVQTMCSAGQMDYDSNGNIYGVFGSINYADYPVLGAYGEEGALRARPQY